MLEWVGATVRSSDGADAIRAAVTVDMHEQMARGFEAYLMEGKAPTQALRKIFARLVAGEEAVRQALKLHFVDNKSQSQIALSLGCGKTTVREYLHRAKSANFVNHDEIQNLSDEDLMARSAHHHRSPQK